MKKRIKHSDARIREVMQEQYWKKIDIYKNDDGYFAVFSGDEPPPTLLHEHYYFDVKNNKVYQHFIDKKTLKRHLLGGVWFDYNDYDNGYLYLCLYYPIKEGYFLDYEDMLEEDEFKIKNIVLTKIQVRILELIIKGKSRQEIAYKMKLHVSKISNHLRDMNGKNKCNISQLIYRYACTYEKQHSNKNKYRLKIV